MCSDSRSSAGGVAGEPSDTYSATRTRSARYRHTVNERSTAWGWELWLAAGLTRARWQPDPRRAGSFWLHALIGEGGQGAAYLATGDPEGRTGVCVVKAFPHWDFGTHPLWLERAERSLEAQLRVADLAPRRQHRLHVPRVLAYDLHSSSQRPWIAYDYCGPNLAQYRDNTGLGRPSGPSADTDVVAERRRLLLQLVHGLATAVQQLHDFNVVHRDIKPSNVLVDTSSRVGPQVRLCDLDLARGDDQSTLTRAGIGFGTSGYSAPEQLLGEGGSARSDVYSVAATALFLSTGGAPITSNHRTVGATLDPGVRADFGEEVAGWLDQALNSSDPDQRPTLADLRQVLPRPWSRPNPPGSGAAVAPPARHRNGRPK